MTSRDRTVLNALLFIALIAGSFRPFLLRLVLPPHRMPSVPGPVGGVDRKPLRLKSDPTPPELRALLANARNQIPPGARVALVVPPPFDSFSYEYWRANYELTGRTVLYPFPGAPEAADYLITWQPGTAGTVTKRR